MGPFLWRGSAEGLVCSVKVSHQTRRPSAQESACLLPKSSTEFSVLREVRLLVEQWEAAPPGLGQPSRGPPKQPAGGAKLLNELRSLDSADSGSWRGQAEREDDSISPRSRAWQAVRRYSGDSGGVGGGVGGMDGVAGQREGLQSGGARGLDKLAALLEAPVPESTQGQVRRSGWVRAAGSQTRNDWDVY